ncbi:hypothetical protein [Duganella aceris]|jgi:hypothetical protein|uniref:hypothetical protein n=1 Tax=Duganella aceris TaxID=2703883 RepID=UPI001E48B304|nr:hypothetical protein [Duganella aceris]
MPPQNANPVAQAQAAMHRTALLLARCSHHDTPQPPPTSLQARWYADQQRRLLAWLDRGGFAQSEAPGQPTIENSGIAPLFSAPLQDSDEESKFSLVRINDAVE